MQIRYYTGAGSRDTPEPIQHRMERIAADLAEQGFRLRSGHAPGADQAFERGCRGLADIFVPNQAFEADVPVNGTLHVGVTPEARDLAHKHHPGYRFLSKEGQELHARNCFEVLGLGLDTPSELLVCWTLYGRGHGGTAQAIRLARAYNVPIFDLGSASGLSRLQTFIASGFAVAPPETERALTAATLNLFDQI